MAAQLTSATTDPSHRVGPLPASPASVTLGRRRLGVVGSARLYVCGITPYDVTHLGHASTFVWADLLASALASTGVSTRVCRNVTDVDDVLSRAARERGRHFDELAVTQEAVFEQSMRALRVATPAAQPRARHHVQAVQQLAQALLDAGRAHEHDGAVWFHGADVAASAGLAESEAVALLAAYGDETDAPGQQGPLDVALWRPSEGDEPAWASPWGWGRPGWHAECAAMALDVLGSSVDVLVGGEDLRFPHHAYQEAMAEAATGVRPFSRVRLHVGTVRTRGEKMAKSTGNLVLVEDVLADHEPAVLRLLLLDRPHDQPWDYDESLLQPAAERLRQLYAAAGRPGGSGSDAGLAVAAVREELDVPRAIDVALDLGGECARRLISLLRLGESA